MILDKESIDKLIPMFTQYGLRVIGALVFFFVAWTVARYIARFAERGMERAKIDAMFSRFMGNLIRWILVILSIVTVLGIFGVQTASFAAVIGSAGLAIGLAMQGSLSNLAAGVMMMVFRRFFVGDMVNIAGHMGKVQEVDLFATRLDTPDNRRIIIPNAQVFNGVVENMTRHPIRRADIDVGVAYDADLDKTRAVLLAAAMAVPGRSMEKDPEVFLKGLGASSVDWAVRVWVKREDFGAVRQATVAAVKKALDQAGLVIPFPQTVIHMATPVRVVDQSDRAN